MWEHKCQLHYERDVHRLVNCTFITLARRWLHTHCKCEWDSQHFGGLQEALPRLPEDFTFVFWLLGLIEIVCSFQLHIVYVLVLQYMRPCLGWAERFLYFPTGLATVSRIPSWHFKTGGCENRTSVSEVWKQKRRHSFIWALVSGSY